MNHLIADGLHQSNNTKIKENMQDIKWHEIRFRASSWGNLMTEPQSKADKEAGKLSVTCIKELIKIYNQEVFGRKKDITTKQMDKGKIAELDSIALFSVVSGKIYFKNEEKLENEWFTGHVDIYVGDNIYNAQEVWDIKTRWELDSFMPKLIEDVDKSEELQLQVYFDLTGSQYGGIANTLVDCPPEILMEEKRRLLYSMNVISEDSPEYKKAAEELEKLLTFPDIPHEQRVIRQLVYRDDEKIEKMKQKVPVMREWLQQFHEKHINHNKTLVNER